eukprot:3948415-Amphidinium_carterae.2
MRVVAIKWKRYQRLRADLYNPRTQNNCLFMCASFVLRQHGIIMSQQQVRDRTAKLWRAGASCFGGTLHHWAAVNQVSPDTYITQLCSSGWDWLGSTTRLSTRSTLSKPNVRLLLATGIGHEFHLPGSQTSTTYPTCSVALLEMRLLQFQQLCAGGWLRRSSLCSTHTLIYHGGNSRLPPDLAQGGGSRLRTQAQEEERRELLLERQRLQEQFRLLNAERLAFLPLFHIPYWNSTGWSELYDAIIAKIGSMLLLASGRELMHTYTRTGINFYSNQILTPIGIGQAYVWVMSDDIRVRAVSLDMLTRAVSALDLQLTIMVTGTQPRVVDHPRIEVPRLIDFNTSWMSTVFGSYAILTDPMHHVLFLLHRNRPSTPSLRSSAHEVIRFDVPDRVQHFSGLQFQAKYYSAGHMHVGLNAAPPPVPLIIYLSGLDNHSSAIDDRLERHFAKQGNAQGSFLMLFPLRPPTHW